MTPTPDLKAAALAATKGEWRFSRDKAGVICDTVVEHNGRSLEIRQSIVQAAQYGNRHNDMAFIIAASPTTILALIERLQVAEDTAKDSARLDFVLENDSFIHATKNDAGINVYQLWNQDEDEEYDVLSGLESFFPTKRKAIDAAIAARRLT